MLLGKGSQCVSFFLLSPCVCGGSSQLGKHLQLYDFTRLAQQLGEVRISPHLRDVETEALGGRLGGSAT